MVKVAKEVAGFVVLPVHLPSATNPGETVCHYLYLREHDPKVAAEDAARSLFLVNIPVTTTEADLKQLFISQMQGGRIENVYFSENLPGRASIAASQSSRSSKKRKRMNADDIEAGLDSYSLPEVWASDIHSSGATAIVVFVDRPSMETTLKAAKRAVKTRQRLLWPSSLHSDEGLGLKRYEEYHAARFPSRRDLLRSVDGYMSAYSQMEEARARENAKKRQLPDEDGFVTVTRGSKGGVRAEEAKEAGQRQKEKEKAKEVGDFYRFQMRERRRAEHDEFLEKWEGDKKKLAEMRRQKEQV